MNTAKWDKKNMHAPWIICTDHMEQERALLNYQKWLKYLQEVLAVHELNSTDPHVDPEWRFAACAEREWRAAIWRAGLPAPAPLPHCA